MALTVDEALAALASAYDADEGATSWCVLASLTITDTAGTLSGVPEVPGRLWGAIAFVGAPHPLATNALLGNLEINMRVPFDYQAGWFDMHRGEWNGEAQPAWLVYLDIEAVVAIVGPLTLRPPAFARSFMQRHGLVSRTHYRGVLGITPAPNFPHFWQAPTPFTVALTENPVDPKLTGTITQSPSGDIVPPATIEVVFQELAPLSFTP